MKRTFFDYISSASEEKVHSQTLGWLLSSNCDALSDNDKQELLKLFISTNNNLNIKIIDVFVEYYDIDLLIVCEEFVLVIENKLKSSVHSNQLEKYVLLVQNQIEENDITAYIESLFELELDKLNSKINVLDQEELDKLNKRIDKLNKAKNDYIKKKREEFDSNRKQIQDGLKNYNNKAFFGFLNFINITSGHTRYKDITYLEVLKFIQDRVNDASSIDKYILQSYIQCLQNLEKSIAEFYANKEMRNWIANNSKFNKNDLLKSPNIFIEKNLDPEIMNYSVNNNILNTLQLCFLNKIVSELQERCKSSPNIKISSGMAENNRQGLIQITFYENPLTYRKKEYYFGYQIQLTPHSVKKIIVSNGTEKINLSTKTPNLNDLTKVQNILENFVNKDEELKKWTPRKLDKKSKGNYISITRPFEYSDNDKDIKFFCSFDIKQAVDYLYERVLKNESFVRNKIDKLKINKK